MLQISPVQLAVKSKLEQEGSVDPVKRSSAPCIKKDNVKPLILMPLIQMTMSGSLSSDLSGHMTSCDKQLGRAALFTRIYT